MGWRDDYRASLQLSAWGVKQAQKVFPTLAAVVGEPRKELKKPGEAMDKQDVAGNALFQKLRANNPGFLGFLDKDGNGDSN